MMPYSIVSCHPNRSCHCCSIEAGVLNSTLPSSARHSALVGALRGQAKQRMAHSTQYYQTQ